MKRPLVLILFLVFLNSSMAVDLELFDGIKVLKVSETLGVNRVNWKIEVKINASTWQVKPFNCSLLVYDVEKDRIVPSMVISENESCNTFKLRFLDNFTAWQTKSYLLLFNSNSTVNGPTLNLSMETLRDEFDDSSKFYAYTQPKDDEGCRNCFRFGINATDGLPEPAFYVHPYGHSYGIAWLFYFVNSTNSKLRVEWDWRWRNPYLDPKGYTKRIIVLHGHVVPCFSCGLKHCPKISTEEEGVPGYPVFNMEGFLNKPQTLAVADGSQEECERECDVPWTHRNDFNVLEAFDNVANLTEENQTNFKHTIVVEFYDAWYEDGDFWLDNLKVYEVFDGSYEVKDVGEEINLLLILGDLIHLGKNNEIVAKVTDYATRLPLKGLVSSDFSLTLCEQNQSFSVTEIGDGVYSLTFIPNVTKLGLCNLVVSVKNTTNTSKVLVYKKLMNPLIITRDVWKDYLVATSVFTSVMVNDEKLVKLLFEKAKYTEVICVNTTNDLCDFFVEDSNFLPWFSQGDKVYVTHDPEVSLLVAPCHSTIIQPTSEIMNFYKPYFELVNVTYTFEAKSICNKPRHSFIVANLSSNGWYTAALVSKKTDAHLLTYTSKEELLNELSKLQPKPEYVLDRTPIVAFLGVKPSRINETLSYVPYVDVDSDGKADFGFSLMPENPALASYVINSLGYKNEKNATLFSCYDIPPGIEGMLANGFVVYATSMDLALRNMGFKVRRYVEARANFTKLGRETVEKIKRDVSSVVGKDFEEWDSIIDLLTKGLQAVKLIFESARTSLQALVEFDWYDYAMRGEFEEIPHLPNLTVSSVMNHVPTSLFVYMCYGNGSTLFVPNETGNVTLTYYFLTQSYQPVCITSVPMTSRFFVLPFDFSNSSYKLIFSNGGLGAILHLSKYKRPLTAGYAYYFVKNLWTKVGKSFGKLLDRIYYDYKSCRKFLGSDKRCDVYWDEYNSFLLYGLPWLELDPGEGFENSFNNSYNSTHITFSKVIDFNYTIVNDTLIFSDLVHIYIDDNLSLPIWRELLYLPGNVTPTISYKVLENDTVNVSCGFKPKHIVFVENETKVDGSKEVVITITPITCKDNVTVVIKKIIIEVSYPLSFNLANISLETFGKNVRANVTMFSNKARNVTVVAKIIGEDYTSFLKKNVTIPHGFSTVPISFTVPKEGNYTLEVSALSGREMAEILTKRFEVEKSGTPKQSKPFIGLIEKFVGIGRKLLRFGLPSKELIIKEKDDELEVLYKTTNFTVKVTSQPSNVIISFVRSGAKLVLSMNSTAKMYFLTTPDGTCKVSEHDGIFSESCIGNQEALEESFERILGEFKAVYRNLCEEVSKESNVKLPNV